MNRSPVHKLILSLVAAVYLLLLLHTQGAATANVTAKEYAVKSGIKTWVDPETPDDRQSYTTSRGRRWDLVMSDEFNIANRSFRPGDDHIWTSVEKPDGVNGALELLSHNMTSTECDDTGTCYFFIRIHDELTTIKVYNQYSNPPGYQSVDFFYRAGMVQSWNKLCFQGGMVEVRAQLPGAVTAASANPDLAKGKNGKTSDIDFYPTWPGIWMLGNLARAIFSASTNRMWPFSYDECNDAVFNSTKNQRISACNGSPGYGLHPNQGRGAPEIDILEGGGLAISSSIQVAPGMPADFRMIPPNPKTDNIYCLYNNDCKTLGANNIGIPTATYSSRGHQSWYQGLRYQGNKFCVPDPTVKQDFPTINASVSKGITQNACTVTLCPGSYDVHADLGLVDGKGSTHWGIDYNGTCFPKMNVYTGAYLCDPDNQNALCSAPRNDTTPPTNIMKPFNYQMDAISSNWPVHVGAYTEFLVYQIEWVTGKNGYVRWMLDGNVIFEITADAIENVPNTADGANPKKKMLEEPMSIIFNVAISSSWGSHPIYPTTVCRGDGTDTDEKKVAKAKKICDAYPMYLKIDYIRIYQDLGSDLEPDNYMSLGCDPASHPTKEWIDGHIDEYTDDDNPMIAVTGGAFCKANNDCTVGAMDNIRVSVTTGKCVNKRCVCSFGSSWGGPRCTMARSTDSPNGKMKGYGPPLPAAISLAALVVLLTVASVYMDKRDSTVYEAKVAIRGAAEKKMQRVSESNGEGVSQLPPVGGVNYNSNFV